MTVSWRRSPSVACGVVAVSAGAVTTSGSAGVAGRAGPTHERILPSRAATCWTSTSSSIKSSRASSSRSNSRRSARSEIRCCFCRYDLARSTVSRKLIAKATSSGSAYSDPPGCRSQKGRAGGFVRLGGGSSGLCPRVQAALRPHHASRNCCGAWHLVVLLSFAGGAGSI